MPNPTLPALLPISSLNGPVAVSPVAVDPAPPSAPRRVSPSSAEYLRQSKSKATRRAYRSDWSDFTAWCRLNGRQALPAAPETLCDYLTELADVGPVVAYSKTKREYRLARRSERKPCRVPTLERRLATISKTHQARRAELPGNHPDKRMDSPTRDLLVRELMAGIRRSKRDEKAKKAAPILLDDLKRMLAVQPDTLAGTRNRALLLVGLAGAFRRSELVALDVEDLEFVPEGLAVTITHSKTDQDGHGRKVGVPCGSTPETCPVAALRAWMTQSGIQAGALFRGINRHGALSWGRLTGDGLNRIVKAAADVGGLPNPGGYSGHSLRRGLCSGAAKGGASAWVIQRTTGHRSLTTLTGYVDDASIFDENAARFYGV